MILSMMGKVEIGISEEENKKRAEMAKESPLVALLNAIQSDDAEFFADFTLIIEAAREKFGSERALDIIQRSIEDAYTDVLSKGDKDHE